MQEFVVNIASKEKIVEIEKLKNEGNELFRNKKYKEALCIYDNAVYEFCGGSRDSLKIKEMVKQFSKNYETNNINKLSDNNNNNMIGENDKKCDISYICENQILFINICHNISLCYYFLEDFEKSIEYCLYINEMNNNHYKSYHTLGLCYEKLKDYQRSIHYFDRCKIVLLKNENNKSEINRINEKLRDIMKIIDQNKNDPFKNISNIKKYLLDENTNHINDIDKNNKKIKMLHSIYNQKFYILLKENIFSFLFDFIKKNDDILSNHDNCNNSNNKSNISYSHNINNLLLEKTAIYVIYKILSKLDNEHIIIENSKDDNYNKNRNICINTLDYSKLQYYYDPDFIKMILSFNQYFTKEWIYNYIKKKINIIENLKFSKDESLYKEHVDILIYILHIIKYVYVINNDYILNIINSYYLNTDNSNINNSGINALTFLCKKKQFLSQNSKENKKKKNDLLEMLKRENCLNININNNNNNNNDDNNHFYKNEFIEFHFSDPHKYPLCISSEIKKTIQNVISMYENFSSSIEYTLILIFTLLHDPQRPKEKDIEMNDVIYDCIDNYFHHNDNILIEWFVCIKCLFLVDKNIILNYLIGKTEYIAKILHFITNSIGRKTKEELSIYIDVLLLLLNISEIRFMFTNYIDMYINIMKSLNYDQCFLKLLLGTFKLYMHNMDFKQQIQDHVDLFFYAKEMLKQFLLVYDNDEEEKNNRNNHKREENDEHTNHFSYPNLNSHNTYCVKKCDENDTMKNDIITQKKDEKNKKHCELVDKKRKDQKYILSNMSCEKTLKDLIEMLFYLSLHIEFKKQLLEEKNNYILFFLINVGHDINKKKLDNTYKYIYCNTINNLILTKNDEKIKRREINKTNLSNFDNEQIEALEQFYDKLPKEARPKTDPLYDYGDDETSNKLIDLLLYNEKYQMNHINDKNDNKNDNKNNNKNNNINSNSNLSPLSSKCLYTNGTIINIIYNFINSNFFTTNIAESVCEIISKFVKNTNNIGIVLVNNGLKTLLLASKHITNKKNCALALSEIFIYTNPKLIHFYEAYDSLPLLIEQLKSDEELLIFKTLMAITNILTIDENVAIKAMQLNLWYKCFDLLSTENEYIKSASLECICNLCSQSHVHEYIYNKYQTIIKSKNESDKHISFVDMQIIYSFTMEYQNYKCVFAATGALGMLSSDLRLPYYLVRTKGIDHIFSSFNNTSDQNILLRILTFFNNIMTCDDIPGDILKKIKTYVEQKKDLNEENTQMANFILQ
ncbi:tetratricopeptide repeat family protein, putative [Plasmodium sp. DRC-Itaito]|nr:tetratricopeptide repeat family protein, putative [Plasmodium sp. DRC-Itaito]